MKLNLLISAAFIAAAGPALAQDAAPADPVPAVAPTTEVAPVPVVAEQTPAAVPAPVEVVPIAAAAPEPQCELHIWPAERFQAVTTGWGAGFGLLGAMADAAGHADGDKARRSHLASALDSGGQLDALQKLQLTELLHLPASKIITHDQALDRKTVNKILTRRSDSTASCYSELIVTDVFYQKAAMWGRSLRTGFMLRTFNGGSAAPKIKKTTGGNGLKIFPVKPGEDTTAADAELVSTFQKNFTEAAQNFGKIS